jgi:hypothetical protein
MLNAEVADRSFKVTQRCDDGHGVLSSLMGMTDAAGQIVGAIFQGTGFWLGGRLRALFLAL